MIDLCPKTILSACSNKLNEVFHLFDGESALKSKADFAFLWPLYKKRISMGLFHRLWRRQDDIRREEIERKVIMTVKGFENEVIGGAEKKPG